MKNSSLLWMAATAALLPAACVQDPTVRLADLAVTQHTPEGSRVEFILNLQNPNDIPLPLVKANYAMRVKGAPTFQLTERLATTLPPHGQQTVHLAAAFPSDQPLHGRPFHLSGNVAYRPPQNFLEKLLEENLPLPTKSFHSSGSLTATTPATAVPAAAAELPEARADVPANLPTATRPGAPLPAVPLPGASLPAAGKGQ